MIYYYTILHARCQYFFQKIRKRLPYIKKKQPSVTTVPVTEGYFCSLLISNIFLTPRFLLIPFLHGHQSQRITALRELPFAWGALKGLDFGDGGALTLTLIALYTKSSLLRTSDPTGVSCVPAYALSPKTAYQPLAFSVRLYLYGFYLPPSSAVASWGFAILSTHWPISFLCLKYSTERRGNQ